METATHPDGRTMKRWENEGWLDGVVLPQEDQVSSDTIMAYLVSLNPESESLDDPGNLVPTRVDRFTHFERRQVPLAWFDASQWQESVSPSLTDTYAQEAGDSAPPIVVDGLDHAVIDGFHRLQAAKQRGDTHILAYVGTEPRPGWVPHEEHPFVVTPAAPIAPTAAARRARPPR